MLPRVWVRRSTRPVAVQGVQVQLSFPVEEG